MFALNLLLTYPYAHGHVQQTQEEEEEADALDERFGREYAAYLRRERPVPFDMVCVSVLFGVDVCGLVWMWMCWDVRRARESVHVHVCMTN